MDNIIEKDVNGEYHASENQGPRTNVLDGSTYGCYESEVVQEVSAEKTCTG